MRALHLTRLATLAALGCLAAARLRTPEVEALWWLYTHTGGEFWNNNEGWDPSSDPCRAHAAPYRVFDVRPEPYEAEAVNATPWWGVGCFDPCDDYLDGLNCRAGRATALSLRNNGLAGDLSGWSAVAELRNLTVLDLSLNALRGTVPTELGEINNLERLKLDSNLLTGTIPPELGMVNARGVYQLRELTLDNNALSGTLPTVLGAKGELQYLDVSKNRLGGALPPELGQLAKVQALHLYSNSLSGTLPAELGTGLASVQYLLFHENSLSGSLPTTLGMLEAVENFRAHDNLFAGTLPTELGEMLKLRSLRLADNKIKGDVPSQIGKLYWLNHLDLYGNPIDGDLPSQIEHLVNLKYFYVPDETLLALRKYRCGERLNKVGKFNYKIVRDEFGLMNSKLCPDEKLLSTEEAFWTLDELSVLYGGDF